MKSNRFAVGAQLTVKAGDLIVYREVKGSEGFGATSPYRQQYLLLLVKLRAQRRRCFDVYVFHRYGARREDQPHANRLHVLPAESAFHVAQQQL